MKPPPLTSNDHNFSLQKRDNQNTNQLFIGQVMTGNAQNQFFLAPLNASNRHNQHGAKTSLMQEEANSFRPLMSPTLLPTLDTQVNESYPFVGGQGWDPFFGYGDEPLTDTHTPSLVGINFDLSQVSLPQFLQPQSNTEVHETVDVPTLRDSSRGQNVGNDTLSSHVCYYEPRPKKASTPIRIFPKPTPGQQVGSDEPSPPRGRKRRQRFDEEGRAKVNKVRKLGACFRCRIYKLTCNEENPCMNCIKVQYSQKVYRGPCVRLNIDAVQSFRAGDGDNGTVRAKLPTFKWPLGGKVMTIELQWPFHPRAVDTPVLTIACHEFQPSKEPLAEEYTAGGLVHRIEFEPWACRDTDFAQKDIGHFLAACQGLLEYEIEDQLEDPILLMTWQEVKRYRNKYKTPMITHAMRIYAGAMLNSKYLSPTRNGVFGVADPTHKAYFFEKPPPPPQLTYQLQTMVMVEITRIQTQVLKELKTRTFSKDRFRHWYEVFLTIFTLLATIEWVYQVQVRFLQAKQGVSRRNFTNLSFVTQHMFEEWEASALNLIAHFRCVMNGDAPFSQSWDDDAENPRRTGLDAEAVAYIRNVKREVEERKEELYALRLEKGKLRLEKPLAATCELFLAYEEASVGPKE